MRNFSKCVVTHAPDSGTGGLQLNSATCILFICKISLARLDFLPLTIHPRYSAQDVVRCALCRDVVAPLYCNVCQTHLCGQCVAKHFSDKSKVLNVVLLEQLNTQHLTANEKLEHAINKKIYEIKQDILDLKSLLEICDVSHVSRYNSRNGAVRKLPLNSRFHFQTPGLKRSSETGWILQPFKQSAWF